MPSSTGADGTEVVPDGSPGPANAGVGARAATRESPGRLRSDRLFWPILVLFVLFVYLPIAKAANRGVLIGGDWSEYALTAHQYLTHQSSLFTYPTPILPLVYVPLELFTTNPVTIAQAAPAISGLLLIGLFLGGSRLFRVLTDVSWAALFGGVMMTTGPLFLDEMGWSGQSQYLALLFGILATAILLERVVRRDEPRSAVWVGLLLAGAALTEPYVAAYFLMAMIVLFLLVHRRAIARARNLAVAATALLPAIAAIGLLALLNPSTASTVSSQGAVAVLGNLAIYPALYARLTFSNLALAVLYPAIAIAYALTWRRRTYPDPRFRSLVPALVLAWIPLFLFLTPWADLDRSLYFLSVPLAAMVAELAAALPALWSRPTNGVPAGPAPVREARGRSTRAYVVPVVALVAVLTIGAQVGAATHTYYGSLTYYSYPQGDLSELAFLQHENGSLLYISPTQEFFPAAWASGRPVFPGPPAQPALFTRPAQFDAVEIANVLALGASWIPAGNVWVVDGEPDWSAPAPGLLELSSGYLLETLAVDDAFQTITFAPAGAPNVALTFPLAAAPSIVHTTNATSLVTRYAWPNLAVTKTIGIGADGVVTVGFSYSGASIAVETLNLTVEAPNRLPTVASGSTPFALGPVTLTQTFSPGVVPVRFSDTVAATASGLAGNATYRAASAGLPANVLFELHPTPGGLSQGSVTLHLTPGVRPATPGSAVTEAPSLAANDIEWVAIEKASGQSYLERFLNDPEFELFSNTTHYLVFETKWN